MWHAPCHSSPVAREGRRRPERPPPREKRPVGRGNVGRDAAGVVVSKDRPEARRDAMVQKLLLGGVVVCTFAGATLAGGPARPGSFVRAYGAELARPSEGEVIVRPVVEPAATV